MESESWVVHTDLGEGALLKARHAATSACSITSLRRINRLRGTFGARTGRGLGNLGKREFSWSTLKSSQASNRQAMQTRAARWGYRRRTIVPICM